MRNLVYSTNITIDGFCDHTYFTPDEELIGYFTGILQDADLLLYGRITYQLMVPYWPDVAKARSGTEAENEFAQVLAETNKVVFSRTLKEVDGNTRIIGRNLEDEIRILKRQPGKKISTGGVNLASQLMALGLIDEYYFVVHPVIAGKGRRLLQVDNLEAQLELELAETRIFKSGCVGLHYVKR